MDWLASIVEAVDSGWGVVAILILGFYAIAWKYGGEAISLLRSSNQLARSSEATANQISRDIVTNHGSKNLGEAIDRLTEWHMEDRRERRHDRARLARIEDLAEDTKVAVVEVTQGLEDYVAEHEDLREFGREQMELALKVREQVQTMQEYPNGDAE